MAENDNAQEKTEEATPKRLDEAKQEGDVVRSKELSTMVIALVSAMSLLMLGDEMLANLIIYIKSHLLISRDLIFNTGILFTYFIDSIVTALGILLPLFLIVLIAAIFSPISVGGWVFSVKSLSIKLERLDPIQGIKRLVSIRGLIELLKALAKFLLIAVLSVLLLIFLSDQFVAISLYPVYTAIEKSGELFIISFLVLSLGLVVIAAIDIPLQLWQHSKKLKMTRQELKDELKQTDGNPEIRGRIRNVQREIAKRRMLEEVPDADVIVVNPTHFSVALKYDGDASSAPVLVAKGKDLIAMKIREIANLHEIPIFSAPLLARALYFSTKLGQEIPQGLYIAVAKVLAYVYQVNAASKFGTDLPEIPDDLPVPDEFNDFNK